MTKQTINVGTTANDRKGDSLRAAFLKVNNNFDELYTALGLNDVTLNLGAFTFTGSTMSTDDSTNIIIDKPITVNGEITVDGDILPKTNLGVSLGSPTRQFKSLYVSTNTIYINNVPLSIDGSNNLIVNGSQVGGGSVSWNDISEKPSFTTITNNSNTWTFNTDGTLTTPGAIKTSTINNTGSGRVTIDPDNTSLAYIRVDGWDDGGERLVISNQHTGSNGIYFYTEGGNTFRMVGNQLIFPDATTQTSAGITASSSTTLTNKTLNISVADNNTLQIQGNSITSYSGSGSVVALTSMPTLYGLNVNNSSLTIDGGTGSYYWKPTFADGTGTIHKAGIYKSNPDTNNALYTFGANGAGTMSVAVEGSVFIGSALPSNNGGLNTNYGGWLVVQAGAKFGGDLNTIGNFILDTPGNYVRFGDGTTQTTAADFGYLDLDKDTIKGTAGYQYTFATDGYFTSSTSSESTNYFFVAYNTTNANIAAGWTVIGGTANTTVSSVTYPVAGYPGVIRVNLTVAASSTSGFYPVTVTSPDRLIVEIQPNPGTSDKFAFTTSGLTFPDTTVQTTAFTTSPTLNVLKIDNGVHEKFQAKSDATGVVTHDCSSGHVFYHTSPDANWTVNLTNLNLSSGYATAVTLVIFQGGTGYYPSAIQIGGVAQTLNWQGNATPTPSTNRTDVVTFSIIKQGTYTVLGQLTGF